MNLKIIFAGLIIICFMSYVSAWTFNGTTQDINGNYLNNTLINITIWSMAGGPPVLVGSNSTNSNASGWFSISVSENSSWSYKPVITHTNSTTNTVDYIGQSLPDFPYQEFADTSDINFYLKPAGTINITAINSTGDRINFRYQVKDTKLGYPIKEQFETTVLEAIVYVPRDRNYSIMIYPDQAIPVSFDWNNFSSNSSYDIVAGLSKYNITTHTVQKTFNSTDNLIRLSGYTNITDGWEEFTVVPYLLEPGNMIYLGENAGMPYNMSAWSRTEFAVVNETNVFINESGYQLLNSGVNYYLTEIWADGGGKYNISIPMENASVSLGGIVTNSTGTTYSNVSLTYNYSVLGTDVYNLTSGFYNITLPGPAESATYLLFASARNGSSYYGGYKNITIGYSDSSSELNFTMYPLMSTNWGSSNSNISLNDAVSWSGVNISSAKQQFNLVNSSNSTISNLNAHLEVIVDYSNYGAREFTFMTDLSTGNANFYLPLLNITGVKEMNIYSQSYSPKRVGVKTSAEILANPNITMTVFNPGDIEGDALPSNIQVALYKSNSSCDLPNPPASCIIADSASMDPEEEDAFNPLSSIIGGGELNFRMGLLSSGIIVEYINVDMLASGPPDALFDDAATTDTSGNFDSAMRFGSNGPTIYDYVLVSMPYTEGSTDQTGLNENADVNMTIPLMYDENWNILWNSTSNGTSGSALAGNHSHYSAHSSEWETLMGENNCTRNQSNFNSTNPCYIDTTNNRIWIRLPHFSGTQPSVTGRVITATPATTTTSSSSSSSSSGAVPVFWTNTFIAGEDQLINGFTREYSVKKRAKVKVNSQDHYVGVVSITNTTATINVSSTPQQAVFNIGEEKKFDVTDDGYYDLYLKLESINNGNANITIKKINEKISTIPVKENAKTSNTEKQINKDKTTINTKNNLLNIFGIIIIIAGIIFIVFFVIKKKTDSSKK